MSISKKNIWSNRISKETGNGNYSKGKKRPYLYFDTNIPIKDRCNYKKFIEDKDKIIKHGFYPFIHYTKKTKRYKKLNDGRRIIDLKKREISYPSHKDSLIYSYYATTLSMYYEKKIKNTLHNTVLAYRKLDGKCNIHFATDAHQAIQKRKNGVAIALDITGFFDNLNHKVLETQLIKILEVNKLPKDILAVLKNITRYRYVEIDKLAKEFKINLNDKKNYPKSFCSSPVEFRNRVVKKGLLEKTSHIKGIPQGSPISSVLSNIYMFDFDLTIKRKIEELGGTYRRYSDDILIITDHKSYKSIINFVKNTIQSYVLEIKDEKTDIVLFKENGSKIHCFNEDGTTTKLQYLGFEFDGNSIHIRGSSISRYYSKIIKSVKRGYILKKKLKRGNKVFTKSLRNKYSDYKMKSNRGRDKKQNFITYVKRSALITGENRIMNQVNGNKKFIRKEVNKKIKNNNSD